MTDDTQRSLGRLENRAENNEGRMVRFEDRLDRMEEKLDHVVSAIDSAKGGWKALVAAGAVASALTAAFLKWFGWILDLRQ